MGEEQQQIPLMDEKYYSPAQVAQTFDVNVQTIRMWTRSGKLRAIKLGSKTRIPESAIRELAQEMYGE